MKWLPIPLSKLSLKEYVMSVNVGNTVNVTIYDIAQIYE